MKRVQRYQRVQHRFRPEKPEAALYTTLDLEPRVILRRWARDVASAMQHGDQRWGYRLQTVFPTRDYRLFL